MRRLLEVVPLVLEVAVEALAEAEEVAVVERKMVGFPLDVVLLLFL